MYSMNFKLYYSKFIDYGLNFIHCLFQFQTLCFDVRRKTFEDKTEEIWLSPMTKAPTPTEMSKGQSDNTNNATKKFD